MPDLNQTARPSCDCILYDASCGFCARWVQFWGPTLWRRGLAIAPLQEGWVGERLKLRPEELLDDIRLITGDGRLFNGADVYLYATRRIWWAWPFYVIFSLPGFNPLLHVGYRWFARNRFRFSHTCGLQAANSPKLAPKQPKS
jgi:predicted DCC family thiol-disulfide oxidoreductase YuxK